MATVPECRFASGSTGEFWPSAFRNANSGSERPYMADMCYLSELPAKRSVQLPKRCERIGPASPLASVAILTCDKLSELVDSRHPPKGTAEFPRRSGRAIPTSAPIPLIRFLEVLGNPDQCGRGPMHVAQLKSSSG